MDNQNDDDPDLDDVLGGSFEDDDLDDDFDDFDDDDDFDDEISLDEDEDLDNLGSEDDWEEDSDLVQEGLGSQKKSYLPDMSFNAMAIIGALILGVGVLIFQLMTTESKVTIDTFTSALNMSGASDGPIFGGEEVATAELDKTETSVEDNNQGFLYEPEALDSIEVEIKDNPPMPTPITSEPEEKAVESTNPDQDIIDEFAPVPEPEVLNANDAMVQTDTAMVPRPPEDVITTSKPEMAETKTVDVTSQDAAPQKTAEDFLKSALDARREKQKKEMKPLTEMPENTVAIEMPEPKEVKKPVKAIPEIEAVKEPKMAVTPKMDSPSVSVSTADASGVEEKLNMIVSRIENMELEIKKIREGGNSQIDNISEKLEGLEQEMGQMGKIASSMTTKTEKAPVQKAAPKKKAAVKAAPKKKVTPKKTAAVKWELRAAQPGKAWVAKKGQSSMQPVVVGDTLAGIGRINAISYDGWKWVVQGSQGRILQ